MTDFARPVAELRDSGIPNAIAPTAGMGLTLDHKGSIPASALPSILSTWPAGIPDPGTEFVYEADATNGVYWRFKYQPSQATYDWVFVGGPPLFHEILTDESTSSTLYSDLTTVGPTLTLPRAGDYLVHFGGNLYNATAGNATIMAIKRGAAATSDNDSIILQIPTTAALAGNPSRAIVITGMSAGDVVKCQYKSSGLSAAHALRRFMHITPIRVS